jgi:kinetochore protein NDC80
LINLQDEFDRAEAEGTELKERVATQPVQPTDVVRMNQDRSKQEAALRTISSQREAADSRVAAQEAEVEGRLDGLEAVLAGYHAQADRLQLIPASAKRAEGVGFEIRLERGAGTAGEMVNVDLKVGHDILGHCVR